MSSACVSLNPYVDVDDGKMDFIFEKMQEMLARTKEEPLCQYYGFTVKEGANTFHCREGYDNAEGVLAHVQNVGAILSEALQFGKMSTFEVHGPAEELEKLKEPLSSFSPSYWTLEYEYRRASAHPMCVSISPQFQIHEGKEAEFRQLCEQMVASTKEETKCLYYGFTFNGTKVQCREGYEDGDGAIAHVEKVGPILGKAMEISTMEKLEFHGPPEELEKVKAALSHLPIIPFAQKYEYRK